VNADYTIRQIVEVLEQVKFGVYTEEHAAMACTEGKLLMDALTVAYYKAKQEHEVRMKANMLL
jgi:hypothetical protein